MTEPKTPAELADTAAEAIRALNHATMSTRPGWEYPADAYSVVGNLLAMVQRLPQLLEQTGAHIEALAGGNHIRSTRGGNGAEEVAAALDALSRVSADAVAMAAALDTAHSALSPLAYVVVITCPRCRSTRTEEYGVPIPTTSDDYADCARCLDCEHSWPLDPGADGGCATCGGSGDIGGDPRGGRCPCVDAS